MRAVTFVTLCISFRNVALLVAEYLWQNECEVPANLARVLFPANVTVVDAGGCDCVKEHLKHARPHF